MVVTEATNKAFCGCSVYFAVEELNGRERSMTKDDAELQDQEWKTLFDRVSETLRHQSKIAAFVGEDYWILGDNWGINGRRLKYGI